MLDAVTFDLGCARSPLFVFPDVSGLAPLTLPDDLLRGQSHQLQPELPPDSVRRFETAMSAEPQLPPSVVESLMAHMFPESRKSEIASVVNPMPVASVEGPATDTAAEKAPTRSADKSMASVVQTPKVVTVERPVAPAVETPKVMTAERPVVSVVEIPKVVAVDSPVVATDDNPTIVTVERPVVSFADKPVISAATHTVVPAVVENLNSRVEVKEQPVAASGILATPTTQAASSAKPVAMVGTPLAVDKLVVASVEHSIRVAVEESGVVAVNAPIPADSVLRSVNEDPVVASPERPAVQVRTPTSEAPIVTAEKTSNLSADKPVTAVVQTPTVVTVERPVVSAVEAPKVATGERPVVATTDNPMIVTIERPVILSTEHTVVPAVVENLNSSRVEVEKQPMAASSISAMPTIPVAPSAKPVAMIETPVAVEKPMGTSGERHVRVVVEGSSVTQANTTIQEGSAVRSAAERPVVESSEQPTIQVIATTPEEPIVSGEKTPTLSADKPMASVVQTPTVVTIEQPVIAGADKPVVSATEHPTVATVEVPKVVTIEKPVTVILPPEHTVVPAVVGNLNSRVEAEEHLVAVGSIPASPATPAASSAKPVGMVESPVAIDKPIAASVEHFVRVADEESGVVSAGPTIPAGSVLQSVNENPVVASPERPAVQVRTTTPEESIFIAEKTPVQSADKPVASVVQAPTVVTVERSELSAVEAPKVVTVEKPVVATTDTSTIVTIEKPVIAGADKPVISVAERSSIATVEVPMAATVEKPVQADSTVVPAVAPVILENPVNRVAEAEEQSVTTRSVPITPDVSVAKPVAIVETPVAVDKPIVASSERFVRVAVGESKVVSSGSTVPAESVLRSATENPVSAPPGQTTVQVIVPTPAEPNGIIEKTPVVPAERPGAEKVDNPKIATTDKTEEKAVAASAHVVVAPTTVETPVPQVLQASPEVAAASAASARTEVIVETVNQIVEAVVGQILVTPGITHGECEIKIMLKPTVLDGSEVTMSAKDGTLTVSITPATQEASAAAAAALPRLEIALAEHAPAFHHVSVALQLKKGNRNEAV